MDNVKNRIVVKVGTSTLTYDDGRVNFRTIDRLAMVISSVVNAGYEVILVSSGAIAVGVNKLGLRERPDELRMKQAAAAVGQLELMHLYDKFFAEYGKTVGQILLEADDVGLEQKANNLRNTFFALLENGIIPIVNENDSVSCAEIESDKKLFGDNDTLSAIVAVMCRAGKLILLSDIDGFFDADPRTDPGAKLISRVDDIDADVLSLASGAGSARGTGGMISKLDAARIATAGGVDMIIANGSRPENVFDVVEKKKVGTLFKAK